MTTVGNIARAISDIGFHEFRRQLTYKAERYGRKLIVAGRFLPSSKTCSNCGCKKDDLKRSDETYVCHHCGFVIDRDHNAALNLLALSSSATKASDGSSSVSDSRQTQDGQTTKSVDGKR